MVKKISFLIAICILAALILWIFQGWRMAGLEILPIAIPWC